MITKIVGNSISCAMIERRGTKFYGVGSTIVERITDVSMRSAKISSIKVSKLGAKECREDIESPNDPIDC